MQRPSAGKLLVLLALAAGAVYSLAVLRVHLRLTNFLTWVKDLGVWGPVLLALAYIPGSLLFFPGSLLTLGAGFAFGVVVGTVAVSVGSVLGASAAFFVGRFLARGWVEAKVAGSPRFQALDRAVGRQGFKIVLLTRLSPVFPFTLLNYAFGLTTVRFRDYLLASWVGMLPGTVLYVYLGSAAQDVADLAAGRVEKTSAQTALFWAGLAATVVVTVFVTRLAKKALAAAAPTETAQPAAPLPEGGRHG
jgi:uncharacterized membrane protein YdjX (TVP38/TMEM64 family)